MLKLSVITINLNNREGLCKTIKSVINQTFTNFEYIIIDGSSTDGSVDLIKEYSIVGKKHFIWLSESDSGIYEAMNKGIRLARGEYIHFINSGDYLSNNYVYDTLFSNNYTEDIIYGNQIDIFKDKSILNKGFQKSDLTFFDVFNGAIYHSSSFTKRTLFFEYGFFDESYQIIGDYIFFVKSIGFGKASVKYVDMLISYFDGNGVSSQTNGEMVKLHKVEDERAYRENFPPRLLELCQTGQEKIDAFKNLSRYKFTWTIVRLLNKLVLFYDRIRKKSVIYN